MNSYAARLASFTSWPHIYPSASTVARAGFHREFDLTFSSPDLTVCSLCGLDPCDWDSDNPFDFHATRSPECPFVRATQQKKKHRNQKTRQQYTRRSLQPVTQSATQQATQSSTQSATQQATQSDTLQEEELQQANAENTAENTAEKSSGSKAPSTKNAGLLSTIPRQAITQQMENITKIWPAISACLGNITLVWHITAMTTQEEDLLRRSQPNHYGYSNWTSAEGHRTMHIWTNWKRPMSHFNIHFIIQKLSLRQENLWDAHH